MSVGMLARNVVRMKMVSGGVNAVSEIYIDGYELSRPGDRKASCTSGTSDTGGNRRATAPPLGRAVRCEPAAHEHLVRDEREAEPDHELESDRGDGEHQRRDDRVPEAAVHLTTMTRSHMR